MEPIHPKVRSELKRAHPELTEADIERYEDLTSLRFTLDPAAAAERIREIDAERSLLVRTKMPQLAALENAFFARGEASPRIRPPLRIEVKSPRNEHDGA